MLSQHYKPGSIRINFQWVNALFGKLVYQMRFPHSRRTGNYEY